MNEPHRISASSVYKGNKPAEEDMVTQQHAPSKGILNNVEFDGKTFILSKEGRVGRENAAL